LGADSARKFEFLPIAMFSTAFFLISFWLHFPGLLPSNYSDLVSFWTRPEVSRGLVPYVQYDLEYPAISGILVYLASYWQNLYAYYVILSSVIYGFMMVGVYVVYKLLRESNQSVEKIGYFMVFTPVFLYYSLYSFDWIGATLLILSIYLASKHQPSYSGLFLGLSVAARIIPIVCFPFVLREFASAKAKLTFVCVVILGWLLPNLYFMIANFPGFLYPYSYQSAFGVEDSWIGILQAYTRGAAVSLPFLGSFEVFRVVSISLLVIALNAIYSWKRRFNLHEASLLAMLAFVLTSYKFPPQYMILLLPLLAINRVSYLVFIITATLDAMIILWWFTPPFNGGDPIMTTSPVQWISTLRQVLLYYIFIQLFSGKATNSRKTPSAPLDFRLGNSITPK
jgi:hypothetical protein